MKKIITVIFLAAGILISGCSSENKKTEKVIKTNDSKVEKIEENLNTLNSVNFRNSRWGMDEQDVMGLEIDKEITEIPEMNAIAFYEELSGVNFWVMYEFFNHKLERGSYSTNGKVVTSENCDRVLNILNEKYGKEYSYFGDGKIEWIKGKTVITLKYDFKKQEMAVIYKNMEFDFESFINKTKEKEKKDETSIELF